LCDQFAHSLMRRGGEYIGREPVECGSEQRRALDRQLERLAFQIYHGILRVVANVRAGPRLVGLVRTAPGTGSSRAPSFLRDVRTDALEHKVFVHKPKPSVDSDR